MKSKKWNKCGRRRKIGPGKQAAGKIKKTDVEVDLSGIEDIKKIVTKEDDSQSSKTTESQLSEMQQSDKSSETKDK